MGTIPKSVLLELLYGDGEYIAHRGKQLLGKVKHKENGIETDEYSTMYDKSRYRFLIDAPFEVSNKCCYIMKKSIAKKFAKETGRVAITGQMASESRLRTEKWLQNGCNGFNMNNPVSNPMSFWTEQDVLLYIYTHNIPIASIYRKVVKEQEVDGQLDIQDLGLFELERPTMKTTGYSRTGCMFCGFGCHMEKAGQGRFERMKITHPKQYEYIMRPWDEGGLGYKEVIDWINENGNLHISY